MNLKIEQELLLLTCKVTGDFDNKRIEMILRDDNISWERLIKYAYKNKVVYLFYHNICLLKLDKHIPSCFKKLIEDSANCNYINNCEKLKQLDKILSKLKLENIDAVPLKGAYSIDNIYKNRYIRFTNDLDLLIRKKDIERIDQLLISNGYVQADYDFKNNIILIPDKTKKMLHKTKMYNLMPYIKLNDDVPNKTVVFDLSFALDFSLYVEPVNEMLDMAIEADTKLTLRPEHFLMHMCCHHYREASNTAWIMLGEDLHLIKFCDVREFILQKMNSDSIAKTIQFAKKYNLEKALYFTIFFTREIYRDGYETDILTSLNINDEEFMYQFGEKDYDEVQTRKKDFWTSLFSENNKDEIAQQPKYNNLIGNTHDNS